MPVAGQQDADHGAQSQPDAERDADRTERTLFDLMFGVINQIFRRTAALFDGAFRRVHPVFDCLSDSFFHAPDFHPKLSSSGAGAYYFIEYFGFHCCSSLDLSIHCPKTPIFGAHPLTVKRMSAMKDCDCR
jgi:hypothetical protein